MPRYKDKQQEPANFTDTKLTAPTKMDKQQAGVVNQYDGKLMGESLDNIGGGLGEVVKGVEDFKQGYDLAKLSQEQAELSDRYLNGNTPEQIAEQELTANAAYLTKDTMWSAFTKDNPEGSGEKIVESINVATANAGKEQQTLSRMIKQGKIGVDEYVARATLLTKQQIARNPRLADKIIAQTEQYMKISGVRDQVNLDQAANKAAAKESLRKQVQTETDYRAIYGSVLLNEDGTRDYEVMTERLMENQLQQSYIKKYAFLSKSDEIDAEQKVRQLTKPNNNGKSGFQILDQASQVTLHREIGMLTKPLLRNGTMSNREAILAEVQDRIDVEIQETNYFFSQFAGNKQAAALQQNKIARLVLLKERMEKSVRGDTAATIGKNSDAVLKAIENKLTVDTVGMTQSAIGNMDRLYDAIPLNLKTEKPELVRDIMQFNKSVLLLQELLLQRQQAKTPLSQEQKEKKLNKLPTTPRQVEGAIRATADLLKKSENDKEELNESDKSVFNNAFLITSINIDDADTEGDKIKAFDQAITLWSSPEITSWAEVLTPKTKAKTEETVGRASGVYDNSLKTTMSRLKGRKVKIDVAMIGGSLTFSEAEGSTGNNTYEIRVLTNNISYRVNQARKILGALHGVAPNDGKVTELLLNKMPFLKSILEPEEEKKESAEKKKIPLRTL